MITNLDHLGCKDIAITTSLLLSACLWFLEVSLLFMDLPHRLVHKRRAGQTDTRNLFDLLLLSPLIRLYFCSMSTHVPKNSGPPVKQSSVSCCLVRSFVPMPPFNTGSTRFPHPVAVTPSTPKLRSLPAAKYG